MRVIDVDYSTGRATIEVVPRIDYTALASKERALPFGRTPAVRPAPRYRAYYILACRQMKFALTQTIEGQRFF